MAELHHPDTDQTIEVSEPAARVLEKSGWQRTDVEAPRSRRSTTSAEPETKSEED